MLAVLRWNKLIQLARYKFCTVGPTSHGHGCDFIYWYASTAHSKRPVGRDAAFTQGVWKNPSNRKMYGTGVLKLWCGPISMILWKLMKKCCNSFIFQFNPIRPGGAQRPGWPNSQLPIRNLLSYDAQTWWLLVFILETPFAHILAKLVNQGGCCCSFLIETSQKFWKWKIFPMLENCWNWHGGSILGREERFWT